jgi:hypothetical protein
MRRFGMSSFIDLCRLALILENENKRLTAANAKQAEEIEVLRIGIRGALRCISPPSSLCEQAYKYLNDALKEADQTAFERYNITRKLPFTLQNGTVLNKEADLDDN